MEARVRRLSLLLLLAASCQNPADGSPGGTGVIEGTVVDLSSKVGGRVTKISATEGSAVTKGDLLLTLDCDEPRLRLAEAEAQLDAVRAESRAALSLVEAEKARGSAASAQASASAERVRALAAQKEVASRDRKRLTAIGKYAADSAVNRASSRARGLDHEVAAARAQRRAASENARAANVAAGSAEARALAAQSRVRALQQAVDLARTFVDECEVRAPRNATLEDIFFEEGEIIRPGAPIARLVDLSDVWATFYLANGELGQMTKGARAEIIADAWPGQTFVGTISTVAAQAEFTPRNIQTKEDRTRLVYPIEVRLENPDGKLRPGMPVTARIIEGSVP